MIEYLWCSVPVLLAYVLEYVDEYIDGLLYYVLALLVFFLGCPHEAAVEQQYRVPIIEIGSTKGTD